MKPFSFNDMQVKLKRKKNSSVQDNEIQNNFLQMYDDAPPDNRVQIFCNKIKQNYQQMANNHRYYEVCEHKTSQSLQTQQRLGNIRKLGNYEVTYLQKVEEEKPKEVVVNKNEELIRKLNIRRKFRRNVNLVIEKLKKLKMSVDDVINLQIFSKEPYRFGKDIFTAVKDGNEEKIWRMLIQNKISIFSVDHTQKNALIWACIRGYPRIARMLIDAGSDINKEDINGYTPLYFAIKYDNPKCVHVLMISLTWVGDQHNSQSLKTNEKVRNVFNVGLRLMKNLKQMPMQKRLQFFNEQFNYYYPDSEI